MDDRAVVTRTTTATDRAFNFAVAGVYVAFLATTLSLYALSTITVRQTVIWLLLGSPIVLIAAAVLSGQYLGYATEARHQLDRYGSARYGSLDDSEDPESQGKQ